MANAAIDTPEVGWDRSVDTAAKRCEATRTTPAPLRAALADVSKSVSVASDQLAFVADPVVLTDVLADVVEVRNRFDALIAQYSMQAVNCGAPGSVGLRNIGQFVGAHTGASPKPFRAAVTLGRWLRDFPVFEAAFGDGVLSVEHVNLLRLKVDNPRTHFALRGDQEFFVDYVPHLGFAQFEKLAANWLIKLDPDGEEPKEQLRNTGVSIRVGRGGRVKVTGEFDAINGQAFRTAVDREMQKLAILDRETGVVRTEYQRRAAALIALVTRGAAREDGTHPTPLVNIVMSQTVAEWALAQLDDNTAGEEPPVTWNDPDGRCELIDGTPIHPLLALATFGVATFRRTILDADSRPIDVSVNARSFPEWMRTALLIETRGRCATHGCDAPFPWLHIDHIEPHSHGGQTRMDNGQPACGGDNQAKGNQTGHTAWRHKPHPIRRRQHRPSRQANNSTDDDDAAGQG